MNDTILPIGTVCTLKGANKKIMITAFFIAEDSNPDELYDYCGCLWPEGMVDSENHFLFNKEKIEKIHHIGFSNEEEKEFKNRLKEILKSVEVDKKIIEVDKLEQNIQLQVEPQQSQTPMFNTLNLNQTNNDNQ